MVVFAFSARVSLHCGCNCPDCLHLVLKTDTLLFYQDEPGLPTKTLASNHPLVDRANHIGSKLFAQVGGGALGLQLLAFWNTRDL